MVTTGRGRGWSPGRGLTAVIAVVTMVLAACGGEDAASTDATDAPTTGVSASLSAALVDRSFVGDEVTDDGEPVPLADGTTLHLTFNDRSHLIASGGCNNLSGTWELEGATLHVSELASTEMACDEALMAQDDLMAAVLADAPRLTLDGAALALHDGSRTVRLTDVDGAAVERSLVGTRWEITNVVEGEGADATSVTWASGPPGSLLLSQDGTYVLDTDCVSYHGTFTDRDDRIVFTVDEPQDHDCDDPDPTLGAALDALLLQGGTVSIDASHLELRAGDLAIGFSPGSS